MKFSIIKTQIYHCPNILKPTIVRNDWSLLAVMLQLQNKNIRDGMCPIDTAHRHSPETTPATYCKISSHFVQRQTSASISSSYQLRATSSAKISIRHWQDRDLDSQTVKQTRKLISLKRLESRISQIYIQFESFNSRPRCDVTSSISSPLLSESTKLPELLFVYLLWAFFGICFVMVEREKKRGKKGRQRGRVKDMIRLGVRQLYRDAHDMGKHTHRPSA